MTILRKKRRRDILKNKSQFINIFLMIFLGIFVFSGVHAYMDGMKVSGDDFYIKNNLADIWITGENFSDSTFEKIKNIENVSDAERKLTINTTLEKNEKEDNSVKEFREVTLEANFIESNNINKMYLMEGEEFSKDKSGIWIEYLFAKKNNINIGDKIILSYENFKITELVKGIVEVPDRLYVVKDANSIFPTHTDFGYSYISIKEFPKEYIYEKIIKEANLSNETLSMIAYSKGKNTDELTFEEIVNTIIQNFDIKDYIVYPYVNVTLKDKEKLKETKIEIEDTINEAKAVTGREELASYKAYQSEIDEGKTYSVAFTALFIFIAILTVITSTNRFVRSQRGQIGTLKALGFSKSKIIIHYISYNFVLSLLAGILGIVFGALFMGNFFLNMQMSFFEVPEYSIEVMYQVYMLAIGVVILVSLASYLSCRKILHEPAAEALRVERPKVKNTKKLGFTNSGIFKKLSVITKWNIRDISRNKGRTIMGIVGVVGCTMLIIVAFGMLDTMKHYISWKYENIDNFEYLITISSNSSNEQKNSLKEKYGNATSQTIGVELVNNNDEKEANTITIADSGEYINYCNHNEKTIKLENDGVYITEKLSTSIGKNVGDTLKWHKFGSDKWYESKIIGLNRDPQNQNVTMTKEYFESIGENYEEDTIYTNVDLSNISSLDGADNITNINTLKQGMVSMLDRMKALIVLFVVVAVALGFVIIYNLGILSYSEKGYQFATLKVLGFNSKKIRKIFEQQGIWITIISIILAIPLGYWFTSYIFMSALGENYDMAVHINILTYCISIVGTIIVSYFTYKVLSKKIEKIDMVSSLKANE